MENRLLYGKYSRSFPRGGGGSHSELFFCARSQFFVFDVAWWFFCFFGRAIPRLVQCDGQVGSRVSLVRLLTPRHVSGACASGQNSTFGRGSRNNQQDILETDT